MKRRFLYVPWYNNVLSISNGDKISLSLDKNGRLWSWGYNNVGQLGDNTVVSRCTPVSILGANKTFCSISAGQNHSLGLNKNGKVWAWGGNTLGGLGDNTTTSQCTPVSILGANKTFCKIDAGTYYSLGIDKNGRVWGWGGNGPGNLGDNSTTVRTTPVSILGANKTFCSISAGNGSANSLGLDKNGRVWGWGYNNKGQLGDNSITNRCTPVSILGANKTFCSIDAGNIYSLGLDKNGRVWGWGYNYYGQIGDNSVTSRRTPVSILGANKTFCKIVSGSSHSLGIDKNGRVWGWGNNYWGQVGDNTATARRTPVSILGANKTFCSIAAGSSHSLGLDRYGKVWGWGYNDKGQLGDNTVTSERTPVKIITI